MVLGWQCYPRRVASLRCASTAAAAAAVALSASAASAQAAAAAAFAAPAAVAVAATSFDAATNAVFRHLPRSRVRRRRRMVKQHVLPRRGRRQHWNHLRVRH